MISRQAYVRACRNFLRRCARAEEAGRVVLVYDEERETMAARFLEAAAAVPCELVRRRVATALTGRELVRGLEEMTSDLTPGDSLILLRSNLLVVRLLRAPGMGGVMGLLGWCEGLSAAGVRAMVDPLEEEAFVRMYDVDFEELGAFVRGLRGKLEGASAIEVRCALGTNLRLTPRHWAGDEHGFELYTAPVEEASEGQVAYCSLARPEVAALTVKIGAGRVVEVAPGEGAGEVSESLRRTLEKGEPCLRVLAELGIGTNPGARLTDSFPGQMENETIRGTCHFDFGGNTWFGGSNACGSHVGGVVWRPTILADGRAVVGDG